MNLNTITNKEKQIYNTYLRTVRQNQNKPFKPRKNFDDLNDDQIFYLKKLSKIFEKFPQLDIYTYFNAPYHFYNESKHYNLKFYTTQKAINLYSMYNKKKLLEEPDNKDQINFILESLRFISNFCLKNNIKFSDYPTHKKQYTYSFLEHYKNKQISPYVLIRLPNVERLLASLQPDEKELFNVTPLLSKMHHFKRNLYNSKKANELIEKGFKKISHLIFQTLEKQN